MKYHITTYGCQMNVADSRRLASRLEQLGYKPALTPEKADVIVINTCVVRQQPEDRATNRLLSLRPLKQRNPDKVIALMGCMVGNRQSKTLADRFPFVDVFMPPSITDPLIDLLCERDTFDILSTNRQLRESIQDGELILPQNDREKLVSAYVPVVLGCSHACSYCVIPYRRGPERSRPSRDIISESKSLAAQGVKEITLLGQIVDRYGLDLKENLTLADLLERLSDIDSLKRIRFLTSHPNWITTRLLETVAEKIKVCEHIEVPIQSGDDEILKLMRRGYTVDQYRQLVRKIRSIIPGVAIHCDIIVGFPGETEEQFQRTYDLMQELELDKLHIARYSPRPDTLSARKMIDSVPDEEKERRRKALDDLQAKIVGDKNRQYLEKVVEVLVEEQQKDRWRGRTRQNQLVFIDDDRDLRGQLVNVLIEWAGPWSMVGKVLS
ncbi:MAG: tRNA (N6-isopentenyl adenosine(37)-C2)-methylthiotransferase MiaB [Anaerolineales bacterium]|nr:tRNA (N6-isopentenyl adenosine(37)-C2)-methylthiotransferase MiaB [Anaerolineales bacterium]